MHNEYYFEKELERSLIEDGGYVKGTSKEYDKDRALLTGDVVKFIQETQPSIWQRLSKAQGDGAADYILKDLVRALDDVGSLAVLRQGFRCYGKTIRMAYFAPNSQISDLTQKQYDANILKVTRQIKTEFNEIPDVVLSVNGIPVVTIELKNEMSASNWCVEDAKSQYKYERNAKGKLFDFKKRTLVHFAVDTEEVFMTTKLDGDSTYFLPFNLGDNGGKGNPLVEGNLRTTYLWEEVLTRDSLMDIIRRFLHLSIEEKKIKTASGTGFHYVTKETMIFPRYHQLDVVRKLTKHSVDNGAGHNYLVQHSAGSGKSNSIAWLAHHLASMHDKNNEKVFNSIIVVTDRLVLDRQLQDTITQFEHKDGVIERIDKDSHQLAKAIASNVPIIITTIQKFPYVMKAIQTQRKKGTNIDLTTKDKRFALIVDEAHSSQSGETATELRKVLNQDGIASAVVAEFLDMDNDDDLLSDNAKRNLFLEKHKRQRQPNLSFFAFTATPKWKTLALFDTPNDQGNVPFHTYTMKQAIEEGFILDVLANYATWEQYFKILNLSKEDKELVANSSKVQLLRFVNMHPTVISQKVAIIVEHFRDVTMHRVGGRAKAMVVTASREQAVRYKLTFDTYIKDKGYEGIKSLVAFSGGIALPEAPDKEYTEVSLNNGIRETELTDKFDTDHYQVLLVAEKYQTGFDQPLLHTMFVDKKLSGVQAVQTLSRLNRTTNGKNDTFVLDFVNTEEDIKKAFKPYYEVTTLGDIPDVDKLEELSAQLDGWGIYFDQDLQDFAEIWFKNRLKPTGKEHKLLNSLLDKAKEKYKNLGPDDLIHKEEQQRLFKSQLRSYLNLYLFVSQIMTYADSKHEKRYVYLKALLTKLARKENEPAVDLSEDIVLQYYRLQKISESSIDLNDGEAKDLKGSTDVGTGQPKSTSPLSRLIDELNEAYGTDFKLADQLFFAQVKEDAMSKDHILQAAEVNTLDSFTDFFSSKFPDMLYARHSTNEDVCQKVVSDTGLIEKISRDIATQIFNEHRGL